MEPIHVLIADDLTLVRAGVRSLLERSSDMQVVAEAGDGREALKMVEEHHPDVVLMGITLSAMNGIEATARIAKEFPSVRVLILSSHTGEEYVWQAFRAGASGYLPKAASPQDLDEAMSFLNKNPFGNQASLFTSSGSAARRFRYEAPAGNIGINIGVAAPMAYFPFSGWKDSFFGDMHAQGRDAVEFYTDKKVVVERWPKEWSRTF